MSYTNGLDNPELYFQTKLFTGNASTQSITLDGSENMQPDWVWIKSRNDTNEHYLFDSVRGVNKRIFITTAAEVTTTNTLTAFDSNGFSIGNDTGINGSSDTEVAWNWSAGGSAPAITYVVKVVSDSGNKYRFDDFGTSAVTLDLQEGGTYTFDQSDSSNATHPLRFYTAADKSGGEYTTGVTTTGTAGSSGAKTVITVAASAPTLYYQCSSHSGMGGQANTNSTFGSSNFSGSIQSTVSANSTAGFSIVKYNCSSLSNPSTVGHSLNAVPKLIISKNKDANDHWYVYNHAIGNNRYVKLDDTSIQSNTSTGFMNNTDPTSSVFTQTSTWWGTNNQDVISYLFTDLKGYQKVGSYIGRASNFPFIYTGFRPAFVLIKGAISGDGNAAQHWELYDNKRQGFNGENDTQQVSSYAVSGTNDRVHIMSNGFKINVNSDGVNDNNSTYIYWAIAEAPFVNSNGVPNNAR